MEVKVCTKCKEEKPVVEFSTQKSRGKLYVNNKCNICTKRYHDQYRMCNTEKFRSYNATYESNVNIVTPEYKKCPKCEKTKKNIEFFKRSKTKTGLSSWCKDCKKEYHRYIKKASDKKSYQKYSDKIKQKVRAYRKNNIDKVREFSANRRCVKINATPNWLDSNHRKQITKLHEKALSLGEEHEVDHIIPLKNELVCGLHVPWNMQVLTQKQNRTKSNKFDGTYDNNTWSVESGGVNA